MTNLLDFPEVQSAVLPFIIALLIGAASARFGLAKCGIGMIAGFIVTVLFVNGISLQPLTAARKIILLGIAAAIIGAVADHRDARWSGRPLNFALLSVLASTWVLGLALSRKSGLEMLAAGVGITLYTGWITYWLDRLHDNELRATSITVGLGVGTGFAAIIGSSALFGQLAISISASGGAVMLLGLLLKNNKPGSVFTLPAGVLLGIIGCTTVAFAELPWTVLVVLALIPLAARYTPIEEVWPRWIQAAILTISTLVCAGIALAYAWYTAGSSSYS